MRKATVIATLLLFLCAAAFAQSAKTTVQLSNQTLIPWTADPLGWTNLLNGKIHTSQQKDLIVGVSLQTGLYTQTSIKGKTGIYDPVVTWDTSTAESGVKVRVLIDGKVAEPGSVWYDRRLQKLSGLLGQVMFACSDKNLDGTIGVEECNYTPEEIDLVLKTLGAHHFNFVLTDVGAGDHTIVVQVKAALREETTVDGGTAEARAMVGKGSLTVEEVRLVKDLNIFY